MADELTHYSVACRKCGTPISYDLPLDNEVIICPNCNTANLHDIAFFPTESARGTE